MDSLVYSMDKTNYKLLSDDSPLSHKQVLAHLAARHLDPCSYSQIFNESKDKTLHNGTSCDTFIILPSEPMFDSSLGGRPPTLEEICNTLEYYNDLDSAESV